MGRVRIRIRVHLGTNQAEAVIRGKRYSQYGTRLLYSIGCNSGEAGWVRDWGRACRWVGQAHALKLSNGGRIRIRARVRVGIGGRIRIRARVRVRYLNP